MMRNTTGIGVKPKPGSPGGSGGANYKRELNVIMANLNMQIEKIEGASMKGLINAAIYVRNETEKTSPTTPIDLGNLRSSWFITTATQKVGNDQWNTGFRNTKKGKGAYSGSKLSKTAASMATDHANAIADAKGKLGGMNTPTRKFLMMGYSANYAGYVHEFVNAKFQERSPAAGAKWFQAHVNSNTQKIFQIIAQTSKVIK
jgi:hypothetical protein